MGEIAEIVDVQITIQDTAVSRAGFGIAVVVGSSGRLVTKTAEFLTIDAAGEVYEDGDPELKMIGQYFGQELKPEKVIAAQRAVDAKQKQKIVIPVLQNSTLYSILVRVDGVSYGTASYTSDGSALRSEIVIGLIAAIAALSPPEGAPVVTTNGGDTFDVEAEVAGDSLSLQLSVNLAQQTVTANTNIATELAAISAENDEWYCLLSASHTEKDILRAAAYIQARRKIYIAASEAADIISPEREMLHLDFDADFITGNVIDLTIDGIPVAQTTYATSHVATLNALAANILLHPSVQAVTVTGARQLTVTAKAYDVLLVITALAVTGGASQPNEFITITTDPTSDLGSQLAALNYDRTALFFHTDADVQYPEAAWAGLLLPEDAGSVTWFGKELAGVTTDVLTASQKGKALGNSVNTYVEIGKVGFTQNGKMASGRFIDVRMGVDYIQARMEENIFFRIVNTKKIPYTDSGVALIESEMRFTLNDAIDKKILASDPAPVITVPKVLSIAPNVRAERLLPDMKFTAMLAGAIHKVQVRGTVSV